MNVLVGMEYSGRVRDALIAAGHNAMSCDFEDTETPGPHYRGDVREVIDAQWDMGIFFPDCTFVCGSGMHWTKRGLRPQKLTDDAVEFARFLLNCKIPRIAMENPIGVLSTLIRKPDQIIQPYQFGDDASKATCLWLKNLPKLTHTHHVSGRIVTCKGKQVERWSNQTDSGQNKLAPAPDRWKERSRTYPGIANAMASQWGSL
jgi:hypothetical protein